jgi:hypothetical protein
MDVMNYYVKKMVFKLTMEDEKIKRMDMKVVAGSISTNLYYLYL